MGDRNFIIFLLVLFLSMLCTILVVFEGTLPNLFFIFEVFAVLLLFFLAGLSLSMLFFGIYWGYGVLFLYFLASLVNLLLLFTFSNVTEGILPLLSLVSILGFILTLMSMKKPRVLPSVLPHLEVYNQQTRSKPMETNYYQKEKSIILPKSTQNKFSPSKKHALSNKQIHQKTRNKRTKQLVSNKEIHSPKKRKTRTKSIPKNSKSRKRK